MQTMYTKVDGSALTCLNNLIVELFLNLSHNLLDACRMYTSVSYKLMQGKSANLTANWVECRDNNSFRSVVNNNLHASCSLKSTYVSTLTTDDTSLHLIILDMEHAYRILNSCLGSNTLYCLNDNLLSLSVGIELGIVHNLVDVRSCISASLILKAFHKAILGLFSTKS